MRKKTIFKDDRIVKYVDISKSVKINGISLDSMNLDARANTFNIERAHGEDDKTLRGRIEKKRRAYIKKNRLIDSEEFDKINQHINQEK